MEGASLRVGLFIVRMEHSCSWRQPVRMAFRCSGKIDLFGRLKIVANARVGVGDGPLPIGL